MRGKSETMTIEKKKRNEILLVAGLLIIILLLFLGNRMKYRDNAKWAEIKVDGQLLGTYPLNQKLDMVIDGVKGGTNHLIIKDGGASITEASCPDKVCVHQGIVKEAGQSLVCLPNKVIVTLK